MTENDNAMDGTEREWISIAEDSHHPEHWHYGQVGTDEWASITASDNGSIGGFYDDNWTVEFYNGEEPCERERVESYAEMLEAVAGFMKQHERLLQADT